ncbi:ATP-binding cassette domain-containing protein, partial [Paenibacillus ehimensis]|uniref:ATP-binding cassette domain-containing protein n=1 Tax=Paenibacillus ehimensis TaxID=79264 RepID=UPI0004714296
MSARQGGIQLNIRRVTKRFGDRAVLNEITLDLNAGEFVAVVGRSGCGKSTLLRLVGGLETADEGTMLLDGREPEGIDPDTRLLFQEARLLPWKKVLANVQIGAKAGDRKKAQEALRLVGLEERANEWPGVLSG